MSDQWLPVPRARPHRCHRTNSGEPADGPYFEHDWLYTPAHSNPDYAERCYLSARFLHEMLQKPGSPFLPVTPAEWGDLERACWDAEDEVEQLRAEIATLREDLAQTRAQLRQQAPAYDTFLAALRDHDQEKAEARMAKARAGKAGAA